MGVFSGPEISSNGLVFKYDRNNGKSFVGAPVTNTLPSPAVNGLPTYGNGWGTYNTNQYNNNAYFSIGTIVSVVSNIVTTSGNHPLRSYDVVTPQTTGGGVTAGTNYLVKKLSNTTFSLHTHNSSQDGSQGYINPATGNFKVYDDFANDVRISINSTSFPTMWWGYPHLPNSALVKEIIPGGFNGLPEGPVTNCIRLHFHRTDGIADGMAYSVDAAVTAGNVWTASFWARAVTQSAAGVTTNNFQIYNYGGANSPTNPGMSWTLGPVGVWQRHSLTWTANNPLAISYWFPGVGGCKFDIANIQYELGSTPSNFTTGTRSDTQALLDMTKRNTITTTSLTYASNGSFSFNGTSNYLTILNNASLQVGTNFTISAWVHPTSLTTRNGIFSTRTANEAGCWQLEVGPGNGGTNRISVTGVGIWIWDSSDNAISINNWVNICYVRSGTEGTMYVNGNIITPVTTTAYSILDNASNKVIGSGTNLGQLFSGFIDDVSLYNRALTASEVQQNFNAQRIRFGI